MAADHGVAEPVWRYDQKASFDSFHPVEMRSVEDALEERWSHAFPKTFSDPPICPACGSGCKRCLRRVLECFICYKSLGFHLNFPCGSCTWDVGTRETRQGGGGILLSENLLVRPEDPEGWEGHALSPLPVPLFELHPATPHLSVSPGAPGVQSGHVARGFFIPLTAERPAGEG